MHCLVGFCCRPVRETLATDERQENQKEEVDDQEMHSESILERVLHVRGRIRTDSGEFIRINTRYLTNDDCTSKTRGLNILNATVIRLDVEDVKYIDNVR